MTGQRTELKRAEVPAYDAALYRTSRIDARASDGASVPVTLAYRADTPLDGTAPCQLYGYGAYESCLDAEFDRSLPSLLDRGVVYAVAHVRGGGERGRDWWQQGKLRAKPRTFSDFIDVADWLAGDAAGATPLVDGRRIVSRGLSAGGLLQGAVYSRAPGRWRAVVAEVPFVDCVTTMLDPAIPLTITEWDEWGDPRDPGDFACLRSYSPYDNPPAGPRPDLLVTGAVHDPRVLVHEPAKWVARLRETDTAGSRVLFRVELGAGRAHRTVGPVRSLALRGRGAGIHPGAAAMEPGRRSADHRHQAAVPVRSNLRAAPALDRNLEHVRARAAGLAEVHGGTRRSVRARQLGEAGQAAPAASSRRASTPALLHSTSAAAQPTPRAGRRWPRRTPPHRG